MPKEKQTVLVKEINGEALRYHVESWSKPGECHMVDLSLYSGNGACDCIDFTTRRKTNIAIGCELFTDQTSCRHVRAARNHWMKKTLTDISRMICQKQ